MRVAVTSAVFNEEKNIRAFLDALLAQTRRPDEIIIVDDGSTDSTASILEEYAAAHSEIRCLQQENKGPAAARNYAWKTASADICVFTDGDCVPEPDWIEKLTAPFSDSSVGAAAGTYKTLNPENLLARFIGMEIDWRYRNVAGDVDAHGSYNLAVRREILKQTGGFREDYPKPSGEDFDLTYKISRITKIRFIREAVVGHYHPDDFIWYLKNQARRAYDRIKVYGDHPDKQTSDTYTGSLPKYQIAAAGMCLFSFCLIPFSRGASGGFAFFVLILLLLSSAGIPYYANRDSAVTVLSPFVGFARSFAWLAGAAAGIIRFRLGGKK